MHIAPMTNATPATADSGTPGVVQKTGDFAQVLQSLLVDDKLIPPVPDDKEIVSDEKYFEKALPEEEQQLLDQSNPEVLQFVEPTDVEIAPANLQLGRPNEVTRRNDQSTELIMRPNAVDAAVPTKGGVSSHAVFGANSIFQMNAMVAKPVSEVQKKIMPQGTMQSQATMQSQVTMQPQAAMQSQRMPADATGKIKIALASSKPDSVMAAVTVARKGVEPDIAKQTMAAQPPSQSALPESNFSERDVPVRHDPKQPPAVSVAIHPSMPVDKTVTTFAVQPLFVDEGVLEFPNSVVSPDFQKTGSLQSVLPADVRNAPQTFAPATAQQLAVAVHQTKDGVTSLVLNPEELGRVKLAINTQDGVMAVTITTERVETQDLMRRHIDMLAQEMRELGYNKVGFSFEGQGGAAQENQTNLEQNIEQEVWLEDDPAPLTTAQSGLDLRL